MFQALQKQHGGTQYALSSGSSASLSKRSSHSSVLVALPTQDWNRDDPIINLSGWTAGNFPFGNLLTDALMWSRPVEIRDVETQHTMELLLTEDQYVIQALAPHTQEKAFTNRIGAFRVIGCFQYLNAARCCHASETGSKLAIMIADELLRRLSIGSGLPQGLGGPRVGRSVRHPDMAPFP